MLADFLFFLCLHLTLKRKFCNFAKKSRKKGKIGSQLGNYWILFCTQLKPFPQNILSSDWIPSSDLQKNGFPRPSAFRARKLFTGVRNSPETRNACESDGKFADAIQRPLKESSVILIFLQFNISTWIPRRTF